MLPVMQIWICLEDFFQVSNGWTLVFIDTVNWLLALDVVT